VGASVEGQRAGHCWSNRELCTRGAGLCIACIILLATSFPEHNQLNHWHWEPVQEMSSKRPVPRLREVLPPIRK
jgi:hypothetical protein